MKFRWKKTEESEKKEKRPIKEKALQVLKYIGTGAAVVAGGAAAVIIAGLASSADGNKEESNSDHEFDPYYEPFADPNSPSYIETDSYGEIGWDDDEDPSDESYGAEDYYSSRPWTDE